MSTQQRILFQKPVYMKYNKDDGNLVPAYIFNATIAIDSINVFAEPGKTEITALIDGINDNKEWYMDILRGFVLVANQSFNKSYSVDALAKHIKHNGLSNSNINVPTAIEYKPKLIMLAESSFTLVWIVQKEEKIDVPDLEAITDSLAEVLVEEKSSDSTDVSAESSGLDELDADSLPAAEPMDFSSSIGGAGSASSHKNNHIQSRQGDKRKIHEAHLRMKLAQYKAEKAIAKYIEKYGDEDLTDFDSDESDFSSDDESED